MKMQSLPFAGELTHHPTYYTICIPMEYMWHGNFAPLPEIHHCCNFGRSLEMRHESSGNASDKGSMRAQRSGVTNYAL